MRLNLLVSAVTVVVAILPRCSSCGHSDDPHDPEMTSRRPLLTPPPPLPLLLRLGEEYFLRLDRSRGRPSAGPAPDAMETGVNRALRLQLTQRLDTSGPRAPAGGGDRTRRSEEPPISLDLTFHLLREVLEMARAEQIAQQAHSNRKMMDIYGK